MALDEPTPPDSAPKDTEWFTTTTVLGQLRRGEDEAWQAFVDRSCAPALTSAAAR